jgi:hypothetical protein
MVAGSSTGNWSARTNWPLTGWHHFKTKYNQNNTWYDSYHGNSHELNKNLKMIRVRLWNSTIGGVSTSVTGSQMSTVIDNLDWAYNALTTNSVDAINLQCPQNGRMQFRFSGTSSTTLSQCANPLPWDTNGAFPRFGLSAACVNQAYNNTTSNGSNVTNLHIVVVPSIQPATVGGFHIRGNSASNPTWYWIAIEEAWFADPDLAMMVAHEIGHWLYYPDQGEHFEDFGGSCSSTVGDPNNNLMCRQGGRRLTSAQCSGAAGAQPFYYVDHN